MNRRAALTAVVVSAVLVLLLLIWLLSGGDNTPEDGQTPPPPAEVTPTADEPGGEGEAAAAPQMELFFPGPGQYLYAERRPILPAPTGEEDLQSVQDVRSEVRRVVEALLAGSPSAGRSAPLPEGVTLTSVYLGVGGVVYLDFQGPEGGPPPSTGSMAELLTVYSVVNSVTRNVPEVEAVVLLWNGNQQTTFSGHVDTSRPLTSNPRLLAR